MVTKDIAYNERFVHLQTGLCKCQYLGALGPSRLWTHSMATRLPSFVPYFGACEVNCWVKPYLPDGLFLSVILDYFL